MEAYQCIAGMYLIGEDMSRETNCVTLHPTERDQFGMPVPNVNFDDHENDIAMRNHAYKHGAMVYDAVGATRIVRTPPGPSTHNLGTCRLSHRPEDGVCNKWGQTHDIENLFISERQPVHNQHGRKSDPDNRRARDSSSRLHCRPSGDAEYLKLVP